MGETRSAPARRTASIRVRALAKLNLSLRVLGVRPDGYHELRTQFQSIALHDTLTFRSIGGPFCIRCDEAGCPTDAKNLVWQAAQRLWAAVARPGPMPGVSVRIAKRIPVRAGLGGGSSDAAAALRALAMLWRARVSRERMLEIAAEVGADVPFFLHGGSVLGLQRGDVLVPQHDVPAAWIVVVVPPFGVSTADAFQWFDHRRGGGPALANDLEQPVAARHPESARLVQDLRDAATQAGMSGSGSAVFGLFDRRTTAAQAAKRLDGGGRRVFLTRTVARAEYARMTRLAR